MTDHSFIPLFLDEEIYLIKSEVDAHQPDFLGSNRKNILILIKTSNDSFLSEPEDALLQKILQSVELTYDDVALVNVGRSNYDQITFHKVLSFGVAVPPLTNFYHLDEIDQKQWLMVDTLKEISEDRNKKKQLWQYLQLLFPKD